MIDRPVGERSSRPEGPVLGNTASKPGICRTPRHGTPLALVRLVPLRTADFVARVSANDLGRVLPAMLIAAACVAAPSAYTLLALGDVVPMTAPIFLAWLG